MVRMVFNSHLLHGKVKTGLTSLFHHVPSVSESLEQGRGGTTALCGVTAERARGQQRLPSRVAGIDHANAFSWLSTPRPNSQAKEFLEDKKRTKAGNPNQTQISMAN